MTVLGIDTSKWDGNWDADRAKKAGAAFVFIKSSQANYTDVQFSNSWKKAKTAGLLRGAYHYLNYNKPAIDQANYFADLLKNDPGELPPTVDYEQTRNDNNITVALSFLRGFIDQLITRTELFTNMKYKVPMIYTGPSFWAEYGDQTKRAYWLQFPLWIANYTTASNPVVPAPWTMWDFWQYSAKGPGEVYGSESLSIDMNRFNGTLRELREFAGLPPVAEVTDSEKVVELEKRTESLEEAYTKIKLSTEGGLLTRVEDIEQNLNSLSISITTSHADLERRLKLLEEKITAISQPAGSMEGDDNSSDSNNTSDDIGNTDESASAGNESGISNTTGGGNANGTSTSEVPVDGNVYATCKVNVLNVRKGGGTNYSVVSHLVLGQRVKVLDRKNSWAQIEEPSGWVYDPYIVYESSATTTSSTTTSTVTTTAYGVCNTTGLNVRNCPHNTNAVVGTLTYGQRVRILDRKDGWAQIETPSGWCNENYLSFK